MLFVLVKEFCDHSGVVSSMSEAKHFEAESEDPLVAGETGHTGLSYPERPRSKQPLFGKGQTVGEDTPGWLRPFFSLQAQLIVTYSILLVLIVLIVCWFVYRQGAPSSVVLIGICAAATGVLLVFVGTTWLLRPLGRVIDVAQAIAIGDLEQRERLVFRLPPQDDIDRLTGSLNEMVKRLEVAEEMQQVSEQRFKRFFSDASHQLRTPLTSIRGFTEILIRGAINDTETRQRVLVRMKSEAERMTTLINDLLTLARLDDGHPLKLQYVDIVEVAMEVVSQARKRSGEGCEIMFDLATEERLGLQADRDRLKQLLFVLLDNAIKYGKLAPEGVVTVKLSGTGNQVLISVIDNGEGIDKADLEHIFDPFYRGRRGRGAGPMGAGLGLTIASTIARAHRGSISANSQPGRTEFTVKLQA